MLEGYYKIDGVDIWKTYGAAILRGSYNSLFAYPERKNPDFDDWFEQDRIDVDYTNPVYNSNEVTIKIGIYANNKNDLLNNLSLFQSFLNKAGYRIFDITGINASIELRYKGAGNATSSRLMNGNQFYLEQDLIFSNDRSLQFFSSGSVFDETFDYTFTGSLNLPDPKPYTYIVWPHYSINGKTVTSFGMAITECNAGMLVFDELKIPLENTYINKNGTDVVISNPLSVKEKTLNVGLVMAATNTTDLLNNYYLLFRELSIESPISLMSVGTGKTYKGYYSKQNGLDISISTTLKTLEFNLELIITDIDG